MEGLEGAECLSKDSTASSLNEAICRWVSSRESVVVNDGHQIIYLFANYCGTFLADQIEVRRHNFTQRQVLVEPPQGFDRMDNAQLI